MAFGSVGISPDCTIPWSTHVFDDVYRHRFFFRELLFLGRFVHPQDSKILSNGDFVSLGAIEI